MFSLRSIAGPLVVGIQGSLWRGYRDYRSADLAFRHAEADGVVMQLTLRVPLASRFLQL